MKKEPFCALLTRRKRPARRRAGTAKATTARAAARRGRRRRCQPHSASMGIPIPIADKGRMKKARPKKNAKPKWLHTGESGARQRLSIQRHQARAARQVVCARSVAAETIRKGDER